MASAGGPSREVDALVIGAGIIGCAVALHLARAGHRVLVVDAEANAGAGSTGASSAIIRFHYTNRDSVVAAWESYHQWTNWHDYLGTRDPAGTAAFIRTGALVLESPEDSYDNVLQHFDEAGVPYQRLTSTEIAARYPAIDPHAYGPPAAISEDGFWAEEHGVLGGYITPDAGYIDDPQLAAHNLMIAAQAHGARFAFRKRVAAVPRANGRAAGVTLTSGQTIAARIVVNAAGPASDRLNQLAGVTHDMRVRGRPLRVETHVLPAPPGFRVGAGGVFVTDPDLGTAFRPHGTNEIHISSIEPECDALDWIDDPDDFDRSPTSRVYDRQAYRAARRLPELRVPASPNGVGALYDVTPDWTPIFDRSGLHGFYLACGTSGNAFKLAPMAGRFLAALVLADDNGHDHDRDPLTIPCPATGHQINLATFSRLRQPDDDRPNNVLG